MKVDVIIPLYKPGKELFHLIEMLKKQTVSVENIILMNTEEKYFTQLTYGSQFSENHKQVKVFHLSKREFDHGMTRRKGVERSDADVFVMMTQDAMPENEYLLEKLVASLKDDVAVAYARQLPRQDCSFMEKYIRSFNYPETSRIKSLEDLETLGIKTYFCSNVCAAYRREIYEKLGGFVNHTIFNEDMIYAAGAMKAGYRIAYVAEAQVIHSHNYTGKQQFHRNFDLGVSQAQYPEIFANVPAESEGKKLVLSTARYLWDNHRKWQIATLVYQSVCKYAGYFLGKRYRKLPDSIVIACSDNKEFWKKG